MGAVIVELDAPDDIRRGFLIAHLLNVGKPRVKFLYIIVFHSSSIWFSTRPRLG